MIVAAGTSSPRSTTAGGPVGEGTATRRSSGCGRNSPPSVNSAYGTVADAAISRASSANHVAVGINMPVRSFGFCSAAAENDSSGVAARLLATSR